MNVKQYIPLLNWITHYDRGDLRGDLSAGLTVGVMLIPQGMAYSMLAGLPPIYGLYASTVPLILYAIFGTSRQLAVGPVAMVALLISSGVGAIAPVGTDEFVGLAILLALMVGILQFSLGVFRLGFLVNFLSHPVISGFTSAAALIIGLNQLKHLLGIDIPRSNYIHEILINAGSNIGNTHVPTLILGVVAIGIIMNLKKVNRSIPGPLVVVILGILAVYFLKLDQGGMKIVKEVPSGLPNPEIPSLNWESLGDLMPIALTIALVGFMESIAVAKAIQAKHKNYEVDPNQELIGLGLANILGALFKAFPTTGGFSRTAVNDQAGARTGLASIISAVLIILTLLFLTPLFYFLPKAILASVIMVAVFGLIDFKEAKHLWHANKKDFAMLLVTFLATLSLGIEEGIAAGVVLSLAMVIYRVTYPHMAREGQLPGTNQFRNLERFSEAQSDPEILIARLDAQLFFANTNYFRERLEQWEQEKGDQLKLVILNAKAINGLDSSAVNMLHDLAEEYHKRDIEFYISGLKGPLRDVVIKSGLVDAIGKENFFFDLSDAVNHYKHGHERVAQDVVMQTNSKH
ncbi:MAG: solute carrier family 26 protein [Flavobacteriales bacterium]|nr:solute carrier family 26 protein [Flavobacteriales bacterium]